MMQNRLILPTSFQQLKTMDLPALRAAHEQGRCPELSALDGVADGLILDPVWFEKMRLWRGKIFKCDADKTTGINRLGVGRFEFTRYRFVARKTQSAFSHRQVILLDHNQKENPWWVRRYHDELVEMRSGLYLTCSHLRINGQLRYASYFAFDFNRDGLI